MSDNHAALRRVLGAAWWLLFPCFTALVVRLAVERACSDPYDLLPALTSNPLWGWLIAIIYVASHLWMIAVYMLTASISDSLLPRFGLRGIWGSDYVKILLMLSAFVLEYLPVTLWRLAGTALHCAR